MTVRHNTFSDIKQQSSSHYRGVSIIAIPDTRRKSVEMFLTILRTAQMLIPIMIVISMLGFKSRNVHDYIQMLQLQRHEPHWFFKIVFIQVSIYVSLFFTMLVICGSLIKEQIPKKMIILGSTLQVLTCITSSYFLFQFHNDMNKYELILGSSAFALNGLLYTIDAVIMFQQIIFPEPTLH